MSKNIDMSILKCPQCGANLEVENDLDGKLKQSKKKSKKIRENRKSNRLYSKYEKVLTTGLFFLTIFTIGATSKHRF